MHVCVHRLPHVPLSGILCYLFAIILLTITYSDKNQLFERWHDRLIVKHFPVLLWASLGFSVEVVDEEGMQQLHITEVKPDGLASTKGM